MTEYTISKEMPIPKRVHAGEAVWRKMPFAEMDLLDSFFVRRHPSKKLIVHAKVIASYKAQAQKALDRKFTMRVLKENGIEGVRVWRIK